MCYNIKHIKQVFLNRFNLQPLPRRITNMLCWSLGLIIAALLLSYQFVLAFALVTIIALAYIAFALAYTKIKEINTQNIVDNCTYMADRVVDIMITRIMDMADTEQAKKAQTENEISQAAILSTNKMVNEMQEVLDDIYERLDDVDNVLTNCVLPELGIYVSEPAEDWAQCDVLGREIPYGLISIRISNRLRNNGIKIFADLVKCSENEILRIPDFGLSSLLRIKQLLSLMDLHLKMTIKKEDGIWYYKREQEICQPSIFEKHASDEEEPQKEPMYKEDEK